MSLKAVNLNLLPVLRDLLRSRSVSATALAIARSPSAVSEGLAQLRATFNDPLLVRAQGGMVLTPRAIALIEPVEALWQHIDAVFADDTFDPGTATRTLTIAAHDYHVFSIGPALLDVIRRAAPGFQLRFVDLGRNLSAQLASREVDFVILADFLLGEITPATLRNFTVSEDDNVALMCAGHPLANRDIVELSDLVQYEQIAFHPTWEPDSHRRAVLGFRRELPFRARVAQIVLLPFMLAGTDFYSVTPRSLANRVGPALGLVSRPLAMPHPFVRSVLAWSPVLDADPAHRWFREGVKRALGRAATSAE